MIIDRANFLCIKEPDESVYAFCKEVVEERDRSKLPILLNCQIEDIQFRCEIDDTVDSLVTRYTDYHESLILQECEKENEKLKVRDSVTITLDLGQALNNFSLANAVYSYCVRNNWVLDAHTVCKMIMAQEQLDQRNNLFRGEQSQCEEESE